MGSQKFGPGFAVCAKALLNEPDPLCDLPASRQGSARKDGSASQAVRQTIVGGQGDECLCKIVRQLHFATEQTDLRSGDQRIGRVRGVGRFRARVSASWLRVQACAG